MSEKKKLVAECDLNNIVEIGKNNEVPLTKKDASDLVAQFSSYEAEYQDAINRGASEEEIDSLIANQLNSMFSGLFQLKNKNSLN